jgi:hypothetical protein
VRMAKRYGHIGQSPQRDAMKLLDVKDPSARLVRNTPQFNEVPTISPTIGICADRAILCNCLNPKWLLGLDSNQQPSG